MLSTHKFDVPNPSSAMLVTITTMQAGRPTNRYISNKVSYGASTSFLSKKYAYTLLGDCFHCGP